MKKNVGGVDRIVRGVAVRAGRVGAGRRPRLAWIGVVPLVTAVLAFCPLYAPFRDLDCRK